MGDNITEEEVELRQQEVLGLLAIMIDEPPLRDIALALGLEIEAVQGRKAVYRMVANHINSDDFENLEINERYAYLQNAKVTMQNQPLVQEDRRDDAPVDEMNQDTGEVKREELDKDADSRDESEDEEEEKVAKKRGKGGTKKRIEHLAVHKLKDLKLRGKIGKPGDRKKLTITSLMYQVNSALTRRYSEADVVDAIINIIDEDVPVK